MSGDWDDYYVYASASIRSGGDIYLFYSGNQNFGANPRLSGELGLAISTDNGHTFVKQGRLLARSAVPGATGFAPFSIVKIGSTYYLFLSVFYSTTLIYQAGYFTSTDLINWGGFTTCTGCGTAPHGMNVIEDPADPNSLIGYYTDMSGTVGIIHRVTALKSNPASWSNNTDTVFVHDGSTRIYPRAHWTGSYFELFYAKGDDPSVQVRSFRSYSADGVSFPDTTDLVLPPGPSGAFDSGYITTPSTCDDDLFFYSGRVVGASGYTGIGMGRRPSS